jgi:energy-coupling factor transport system permease protein
MGISLAASLAVVFLNHPVPLAVLACASALYALSLKRPLILLVVYGAVIFMWLVAVAMVAGLHAVWHEVPPLEIDKLLAPFLRTAVMVNAALTLALSSRIQTLLATLKAIRLPFSIYVPLAAMIRFLPTFIEDVRQINECLRTRGHRLAPVGVFAHPLLTVRLLLMPLLFRSLRSSDELGMAAELKGLGSAGRMTPMKRPRFSGTDAVTASLAFMVLALGAGLQMMFNPGGGGVV